MADAGPPSARGGSATAADAARADFGSESRSDDVRRLADWVARSGDNIRLPYVIVDKINAKVFVFDGRGRLTGAVPALLGLGRGDDTVPGIGQRKLATMAAEERTTPAGRFVAALGHDLEQDVLWIDYDASVSLHRIIVGRADERRAQRLGTASALDNRISYGCINVPPEFYDTHIAPAFRGTVGIVYILPETKPLAAVFAMAEAPPVRAPAPPARLRPRIEDSRARAAPLR